MTAYSTLFAQARLAALQALTNALKQATDPAEIRRLAQAIFKAPTPDEDTKDIPPPPTRAHPIPADAPPAEHERTTAAPPPDERPKSKAQRHLERIAPFLSPEAIALANLERNLHEAEEVRKRLAKPPGPAARLLAHSGRAP